MNKPIAVLVASSFLPTVALTGAEDRRERVLNDRKEAESAGQWIYNDLAKGFAEAARAGKPLLVVLRCVP